MRAVYSCGVGLAGGGKAIMKVIMKYERSKDETFTKTDRFC